MKEFIKIHQNDNVAVALTPLSANRTLDVDGTEVTLREDIPQGHKFALTDIPADAKVIKYGCPIGIAKENISCGSWIHTHNMKTGLGDLLNYSYQKEHSFLEPTKERFLTVQTNRWKSRCSKRNLDHPHRWLCQQHCNARCRKSQNISAGKR